LVLAPAVGKREPGDWVNGVSAGWSPDGSRLAVSLGLTVPQRHSKPFPQVAILDARTGKPVQTLSGSADPEVRVGGLKTLHWSPDGSRLACASLDMFLKTWDVSAGSEVELIPFKAGAKRPDSCAWSPDGRWLALQFSNGGTLLSPAEQPGEGRLLSASLPFGGAPWSPAGRRLALIEGVNGSSDAKVRIIDASDAGGTGARVELSGNVADVAWAPGGNRLATCGDGTVRVWDATTGRELLSLP
jgi:WD40 repeat protein